MQKNILILCREITADVVALIEELSGRGYLVQASDPTRLDLSMADGQVDFFLDGQDFRPELVFSWASQQHRERGQWLTTAFELAGIKVVNGASALALGQNKFTASVAMSLGAIPHIPTVVAGSPDQLAWAAGQLGMPIVLKPVYGSKGEGVMLVATLEELERQAAQYFSRNLPVYLQRNIDKPGRDIRVRVIDYVADFAFYRYASEGQFVTNLCRGGDFSPAELTPELRAIAEHCARAFEAPVAGVDLCEDAHGKLHVIEINMTPAITWPHMGTVQKVCDLIEKAIAA